MLYEFKEIYCIVATKGNKRTNISASASVFRDPKKYGVYHYGFGWPVDEAYRTELIAPDNLNVWSD